MQASGECCVLCDHLKWTDAQGMDTSSWGMLQKTSKVNLEQGPSQGTGADPGAILPGGGPTGCILGFSEMLGEGQGLQSLSSFE